MNLNICIYWRRPVFLATAVVSVLLAAALSYSAFRKLSHRPVVVQTYRRAGVPEDRLDQLAIVLLAGAAGLLLGLIWAPVGLAAAACLVVYFLVAVTFHVRADDARNLPTPLVLAVVAAVALVLRLVTA
jgi:DoxX-like family